MLTIEFGTFPILRTKRLVLRQLVPADAPDLFRLRAHEGTNLYLDRDVPKSVEEMEKMIATITETYNKNEGITWAITLGNENKLIGTAGFWRIDKTNHRAEIGYMLHPDHWQKGIITEALKAVLDHGFREIKFHSVEANLNPDNEASRKTIEKQGFVKEAHFKDNYYHNGIFFDSLIYSKIAPKD